MTLVRKTGRCRNSREGQTLLNEFFRGRHSNLRLKGMRRHANLFSEHAIQVKRAKVNQSRKFSQRDIEIMMCSDVFTRSPDSIVFISRGPEL
jgi:hypothetical protein